MNWTFFAIFFGILAISIILIIITLISLPQFGDERKKLIKMKAQSYSFAIVIVYALIELVKNIYIATSINSLYEGMNPFTFLLTTSIVYLISLLFFRKKYGG